jgi:hypothetical protein
MNKFVESANFQVNDISIFVGTQKGEEFAKVSLLICELLYATPVFIPPPWAPGPYLFLPT